MSRRKSDRIQARLILGLITLSVASSILAAWIGYKSIRAVDKFYDLILEIGHAKGRAMEPKD